MSGIINRKSSSEIYLRRQDMDEVFEKYEGAIIKETLTDENILDHIQIEKVEVRKTHETIKYWTMIFFKSYVSDFPERLSKVLIDGWFADMKCNNTKFIIFRNRVLRYEIGNYDEKQVVLNICRAMGIPDEQFGWSE
jgi:hypothetical protein